MSMEQSEIRFWISEVCFWTLTMLAVGGVALAVIIWLSWPVEPSLAIALLFVIGINKLGKWAVGG